AARAHDDDADQVTPPPEVGGALLKEAMDASVSGAIRADDAIVEEEEADVIEELDDTELLEDVSGPQPVAAARPPAPPPLSRAQEAEAQQGDQEEEDQPFATPWDD